MERFFSFFSKSTNHTINRHIPRYFDSENQLNVSSLIDLHYQNIEAYANGEIDYKEYSKRSLNLRINGFDPSLIEFKLEFERREDAAIAELERELGIKPNKSYY